MTLDHGERYGKLTVLGKVEGTRKYRVGCVCGNSSLLVRATDLTKGRVTACLKCRSTCANTTKPEKP